MSWVSKVWRWGRSQILLVKTCGRLIASLFTGLGIAWAFIEPYLAWNGIERTNYPFSYFLIVSSIAGLIIFFTNGLYFKGFLRSKVLLRSKASEAEVTLKFGDIFKEDGWIAVGVNDFFDGNVNDQIIHSSSLHGKIIQDFWRNDESSWRAEVVEKLPRSEVIRDRSRIDGNQLRFPVGTSWAVKKDDKKFIFVGLGVTNASTHKVSADAITLISAVKGLVRKAHDTCGNEPLNIPLMGSGLARVQGGDIVLVDLILTAIFEETAGNKPAFPINIVLLKGANNPINLENVAVGWR